MLLSMAVQPSINPYLPQTPPKLAIKPLKVSSPVIQKISPLHSLSISPSIFQGSTKRGFVLSSSSASEFVTDDAVEETSSPAVEKQKLGVVVKPMEKPRLVLKFIWMEKNIGLGLDQAIPGHGTIPLSPYYFWPRKDAWEELKVLLESKPWISQKQMIILLNQATDIINLWQQAGGNLQ